MQKFVRFATKRPLVTRTCTVMERVIYAKNLLMIALGVHAFHTSRVSAAISKFNLPAMSPTMTEGTIHKWKVKEGKYYTATWSFR